MATTKDKLPACVTCGYEWLPGHTCSPHKVEKLISALQRIMNHQTRANHRQRSMVDVSEIDDLQRIAQNALKQWGAQ